MFCGCRAWEKHPALGPPPRHLEAQHQSGPHALVTPRAASITISPRTTKPGATTGFVPALPCAI